MKKLVAGIVYAIDRRMPRARVGGRESDAAYSLWEYGTGKELLAAYGDALGPLAGRLVLDIGCGLGGKTIAYAEAGARVVGVDLERENVARCLAFSAGRASSASFVTGDARRLPFADRSFDAVIANDSLEHFSDPEVALREFARVVKPDGPVALFFTPWGSPLGSHLYDYIRTPWCHLLYPEWLIRELLERDAAARGDPAPAARARDLMEQYHRELNRITVRRYRRILRRIGRLAVVREDLRPPKYRALAPLARIPLLGELFTGTVVAILRRE